MNLKVVLLVILALLLVGIPVACSAASPTPQPEAAQVVQAAPTEAPLPAEEVAQLTSAPTAQAAELAEAEPAEAEPAEAPTSADLTAQTLVNLNLREGPGTHHPVLANLPAGSEVKVIGRLQDNAWLQVETAQGEGWVNGQADYVQVEPAALAAMQVIEALPPAYDASDPMVRQVLEQIPLIIHHGGTFTCASHGGLNHLLPEVRNGHVLGPHSGDFVYDTDNVLFEYSNGGFQLVKENSIARFDAGAKYLSMAEAMQLFARDEIVWTGSFGQWPGRGVTGCDPAAKP
jgi:uncharacterized protein YraI